MTYKEKVALADEVSDRLHGNEQCKNMLRDLVRVTLDHTDSPVEAAVILNAVNGTIFTACQLMICCERGIYFEDIMLTEDEAIANQIAYENQIQASLDKLRCQLLN